MFEDASKIDSCIDGDGYIAHLKNISFQGESAHISFNSDGDMLGTYR